VPRARVRRAGRPLAAVLALALSISAGGLWAGCGGGSDRSSAATVPASPAAAAQSAPAGAAAASNVTAVAYVRSTPIPRPSYSHWLAVETALGGGGDPGHRALGFLITSEWVIGEAAARGISVSEAEVKQHLAETERRAFPNAGSLQRYMAVSGETEADLLARARVEVLRARIASRVTAASAGKSAANAMLAGFERAFTKHWKRYTSCKTGFVMEDCSEYKGKPEDLSAPASPPGSSSSQGASATRTAPARVRKVSAKAAPVGLGPESSFPGGGAMTLASPAFGLNELMPATYTCDGTGISPPLEWKNVPAKAATLVLLVIDEGTRVPAGGVRWIVGDIDPHSKGVAAGKTPEGAIVGANAEGKTGYGAICPAHGKATRVSFLLFALSKKIPLSPGFRPGVAESEYSGANKLILGEAAGTYASYQRP
jgi:phosphatidylethanolamine-binding protein (PEBP) family uncharacterized protein